MISKKIYTNYSAAWSFKGIYDTNALELLWFKSNPPSISLSGIIVHESPGSSKP